MHRPPRANFFDASALVKVYVDEAGSADVRAYFQSESPTKYTTPFCFYETLTALKVKWLKGEITRAKYLDSAHTLTVWFRASSRSINDIDISEYQTFEDARQLVERHNIDLSDAFQLLSVKTGYFSRMINDSQTLFITADVGLRKAAESEKLKVWYCMDGPAP